MLRCPTVAFTTVEDDPDIAPIPKLLAQLFVPVQTATGHDKDEHVSDSRGQDRAGYLRKRPEPITQAPWDSASATEQVGLFRVTADAMAHRPLPATPNATRPRSRLPVLITSALLLVLWCVCGR